MPHSRYKNQICRRINSTGNVYEDDVAELKARQRDEL